jgi:hypothetical protein
MSIDAMKQALEALEEINKLSVGENAICLPAEIDGAMDALRAAIEQNKPVAWRKHYENSGYTYFDERWGTIPDDAEPLFSN